MVPSIIFFILILNKSLVAGRTIIPSHINPSDVKHFESELDSNVGYWSPSTSSIDWCERNYVVTEYVAEFWNCLSSFSMCILGGILFLQGLYNQIEIRFLLSSLGFILVGGGSAYFHGTLTHLGQMADELPMVYSMIVWWFILFRMNHLKTIKDQIFAIDMLILFGMFYALLWTYVHSLKTFVLIFQGHMALMVIGGIIKLIDLYRQPYHYASKLKYLLIVYVSLLIFAFICWTIDQVFCEQLNNVNRINPQLHAWWHVLGAIHCHLGIVCAEALRLLSIKYEEHQRKTSLSSKQPFKPDDHLNIVFHFGLPYLHFSKQKQTIQTKTK